LDGLPENLFLYRDSGVWRIFDDDDDLVEMYCQKTDETLTEFVWRAYEKESAMRHNGG
jgi:hypothetical protein